MLIDIIIPWFPSQPQSGIFPNEDLGGSKSTKKGNGDNSAMVEEEETEYREKYESDNAT